VDMTFWHEFSKRKLDIYKLDDSPVPVSAYYFINTNPNIAESSLRLEIDAFSPPRSYPSGNRRFLAPGLLYNSNTYDDFKNLDKNALLHKAGRELSSQIVSSAILDDPSQLSKFLLILFADIKTYKFYYWFAFPTLTFPENITTVKPMAPLSSFLTLTQIADLKANYDSFYEKNDLAQVGFFLVKLDSTNLDSIPHKEGHTTVLVGKLSQWNQFFPNVHDPVTVGFVDPGSLSTYPGWVLRNFLYVLGRKWGVTKVTVICYREPSESFVLSLSIPRFNEWSEDTLKVVGWEKNKAGKNLPRLINLASTMDPKRLATTAVDLNLKLMRWRLIPSLDLDTLAATRCLILGAGTLGSNVARCLMGWGIRKITFVDSGRVSFSNPVRQSLFEFSDSLDGGHSKSETAAKKLQQIFPAIDAAGEQLHIPMPGHVVEGSSEIEKVRGIVKKLLLLFEQHDVVFLLTDSRESRWLPTLFGNVTNKLVINAALGFDSYLVARHGVPHENSQGPENSRLGCYFCSDVVAPQDSLSDRTLDQQCTVTRPGVSFIAASLAVELMVSTLHHPLRARAPANASTISGGGELALGLGLIPHQIRGFLSTFNQMIIAGNAYEKCTACSEHVISEYKKRGFDFLLEVFNNPTYLEDLTGLTELKTETKLESIAFDDLEELEGQLFEQE